MKRVFVGIDVSRQWLDAAVCDEANQMIVDTFRVENSIEGIGQLIKKCKSGRRKPWFCFEHTGHDGLLLSHLLDAGGIDYSAIPALEIKRSQGMTRGKSDKLDAARIATYAATHAKKLKRTQMPAEALLKLKSLLTFRDQLVGTSRQWQNSLKNLLVSAKVIKVEDIKREIEHQIASITEAQLKIEKQIHELIKSEKEMAKNYKQANTVKGVGPMIAAYMIVTTNNFQSFNDPRKYNCYAGLAPFEHSSGTSIHGKTKTSRLRNRKMKGLLFNGACSAASHDPEINKYYKRKLAEGKHRLVVLNNIACKLVSRVFAVVNRPEPYVALVR